ncbi:MAG: ligase-associated DNA damage response DEXH box helicase [Chitinophagales bacterium]|nr:ligase-associated DNA damage response DEXH box helicase [Chitinophagaceae bacterium]MCB9065014.1 ligase-associated DNA damage response DEXH box helicase [Chitinophagales bacterium]
MPQKNTGHKVITDWLAAKGLSAFPFQEETWQMHVEGLSGIVNAPTGFGKTYSVFLAVVIDWINRTPDYKSKQGNGLQLLWVSPLRALAKDIARAMEEALQELEIPWRVSIRNGDTPTAERERQKKHMPEVLVITPESLHLLFASKNHASFFETLTCVAIDEWHELLGSKRGVQIELALAHLKWLRKKQEENYQPLRIWGISATIGNMEEAMHVLLGEEQNGVMIRAQQKKKINIETILPESVERFPWAGHLGLKMIEYVIPIIRNSRSTLLFTNVRSQAEMWYQKLLDAAPDLAGAIALHHSSIEMETRLWVEEALHKGKLQVVVCTASLDLGVDFRPVDTVIQIGSPKGIARFMQRAGRSGHSPDAVSNIYFVPTHSLEIVEGAALKKAYEEEIIESRNPVVMAFDVLIQYMVTIATGDGFAAEELLAEVRTTNCYADVSDDEWQWMLSFVTTGGKTLNGYDEYHKVVQADGLYKVLSRKVAMRHRMHIGTIVGDAILQVKFLGGGFVGTIEEYFISSLSPGDSFILAGNRLEFIRLKDMVVQVKRSKAEHARVPAWGGGRIPLSSNLGTVLRHAFQEASINPSGDELLEFLQPLFDTQRERSVIPKEDELLVEMMEIKDGYHLFVYPFEGRLVHQAMASLLAYRISQIRRMTFTIAMNDYGFELYSDQPIPVDEENIREIFSLENWYTDLQRSINNAEMGRRKFRDIAVIAGLIFQGFPGEQKRQRHLQNSSGLLYDVLVGNEPNHLLLQQAYHEVLTYEIESERLHKLLERIEQSKIVISRPEKLTPFCFPIKVDRLREELSTESLVDRIRRMQAQAE